MPNLFVYDSPIGKLSLAEAEGALSHIWFSDQTGLPGYQLLKTPLLKDTAAQLFAYFNRKLTQFDVPLSMQGTAFQRSVWEALQTIPFGETRSYRDIAVHIGNAKAARAVGMANNRNPIPIIVPCHRVIGASGQLVGFNSGLSIKRFLLDLESGR